MKYIHETVSEQNARPYQEDTHVNAKLQSGLFIAAVFDGHGGGDVSQYCKTNMVPVLTRHLAQSTNVVEAIKATYSTLDEAILREIPESIHMGATCSMIVVTGTRIFASNCGDSMAMAMCKSGNVCMLSEEHKVSNAREQYRIRATNGLITRMPGDCERIGGVNISRSFGDHAVKMWVISTPYISSIALSDVSYVVNASDGLWDVVSGDDVAGLLGGVTPRNCSRKIKELALYAKKKGSTDNITISITMFVE